MPTAGPALVAPVHNYGCRLPTLALIWIGLTLLLLKHYYKIHLSPHAIRRAGIFMHKVMVRSYQKLDNKIR